MAKKDERPYGILVDPPELGLWGGEVRCCVTKINGVRTVTSAQHTGDSRHRYIPDGKRCRCGWLAPEGNLATLNEQQTEERSGRRRRRRRLGKADLDLGEVVERVDETPAP